jgi:molybdopterin/thiamine biosynthesis adenylyltransferase
MTMVLPVMKNNVPWFTYGGAVHFRLSGELTSFEDPEGRVAALLRLLDGTRTVQEVERALAGQYPNVTSGEVVEALAELDSERLIQDATDSGADFTARELQRWDRNFGFLETYATLGCSKFEFQRRIKATRLALLGVGGIGSHALLDAVAIGFTDIRIVDFDTVDLSNLNRQIIYDEAVLGQGKVDVAARRARALNSDVRIDPVAARISSPDVVHDLVRDRDAVLVAVDQPRMHVLHWVNDGCLRAGASFLVGGVDGYRTFQYTVIPGVSGCLECWYSTVRETDPTSSMVLDQLEGMATGGHTFSEDRSAFDGSILPVLSTMMGDLVRMVTGIAAPYGLGRLIQTSFHDPRLRIRETWQRRPDCPHCSGATARLPVRWRTDAAEGQGVPEPDQVGAGGEPAR